MSAIITDDNGIPIPQYFNNAVSLFQAMQGTDGAIYVIDKKLPTDGVMPIRLIGKDGKELPVTETGLPVVLSDASVNCMYYNGTRWLEANNSCNMSIVTKASYTTGTKVSNKVYNNGCKDAILTINMDTSATNSITQIDISIVDADGVSSPYKSITPTVPITTGIVSILFGVNDLTSKFVIPSEFTVSFVHSNASVALVYGANLQLV